MAIHATPPFPPLEQVLHSLAAQGNTVPVFRQIPADLVTPMLAYLRLSTGGRRTHSFLFESVYGGEKIGRFSFVGAEPRKVVRTGDSHPVTGDPLNVVQDELSSVVYVPVPGVPSFTGGAIGFISYDCVRFFEPKTARPLKDTLGIPDSVLMFCDTIVVFDHLFSTVKVISHAKWAEPHASEATIRAAYAAAEAQIQDVLTRITAEAIPAVEQPPILLGQPSVSNIGQEGYESHVRNLKHHISEGDIIQAVPSQRLKKRTTLNPLNAYRKLRTVNPSPYMFYVDLGDFQIVGASPEMLVKVEDDIVYTHPIAGTRKRGKTPQEDHALAKELISDLKERAEHVMLVDLGRNDVNRICDPKTVKVDSLMHIERYAHVMHIVSNVSGKLRPGKTAYDAFRSIFPAGTVSGAPKVRAMELIYELEGEKRGVYAGAVGYFGYSGGLDTCIAIRTMVFKDGHVYLQAGGGIVHDSEPTAEFEETVNKLRSNVVALEAAEAEYALMYGSYREE
ncbi:ADC synthase [Entophlyctis helioformis]|nr:ADC synthase [Entophlyctis helioformis]